MEKAKKEIQEREEKKALTQGAGGEPAAPKMNIKVRSRVFSLSGFCMLNAVQGSKISKGARKRGQLASLLVEAYQNREALEEKIAEGRRNRKEAGNKYGAFHSIQSAWSCRLTFEKGFNILGTILASDRLCLHCRVAFIVSQSWDPPPSAFVSILWVPSLSERLAAVTLHLQR